MYCYQSFYMYCYYVMLYVVSLCGTSDTDLIGLAQTTQRLLFIQLVCVYGRSILYLAFVAQLFFVCN